jgi:type I restriction enzyme M protein
MKKIFSQPNLEEHLWKAAVLLRGGMDSGEYKNIIFPLMFIKRLSDVFDEEYENALKESGGDKSYADLYEYRFKITKDTNWNSIRNTSENLGKKILDVIRKIEKDNPKRLDGIFGDANWTNKQRFSDELLKDLIEHYSEVDLSVSQVSDDKFGNLYEYIIKKFANDSGHTAAEFYTNRTVVRLMTELLLPKPNDEIYDPTCGSGGMLLECINYLKEHNKETRSIKLYGQESNLTTSSIACMNLLVHGIDDFDIKRGDTLSNPMFIEGDKLKQFDVILSNPPYSIKSWNRNAWKNDSWKRNIYGTPPQGRADYAFFQHIIASMKDKNGRCAILFPHGILFRDAELDLRKNIIQADIIQAIIGLGKNLFYNSPMESCIIICNNNKKFESKEKILFINVVDDISSKGSIKNSFLSEKNIQDICNLYYKYNNKQGKSAIVNLEEIANNNYNLNIPLYVTKYDLGEIDESTNVLINELSDVSTKLDKHIVNLGKKIKVEID